MFCASVLDVPAAGNVADGVRPLLLEQMREPQSLHKNWGPYTGACGAPVPEIPVPEMLAALIVCSRRTRLAARDCGGGGDPELERIDDLLDMVESVE